MRYFGIWGKTFDRWLVDLRDKPYMFKHIDEAQSFLKALGFEDCEVLEMVIKKGD